MAAVECDDLVEVSPEDEDADVSSSSNNDDREELLRPSAIFDVRDRYRVVYFIFLWLGIAVSAPWNFLITAEDYWQYKLRDVSHDGLDPTKRTSLQANFGSYLSLTSMVPSLFAYTIYVAFSSRFSHISYHCRVLFSLLVILATFVMIAAFSAIDTDQWQSTFFVITMVSVAIMNVFNGIFQATVFSMACLLPARFMRVFMNGQAICGIFSSVARIFTLLHDSKVTSALYFFCCALLVIVLTVVSYLILINNKYYNFHSQKVVVLRTNINTSEHLCESKPSLVSVFKKIRLYCVSVMLDFFTTLTIYPALSILVVSVSRNSGSVWTGKFFLPFACFLLFNCGDFCGRCINGWIQLFSPNSIYLPVVCVLRMSLVAAFMLCNVQPRQHLPVLIESDVAYVVLITLLSLSNGFLASHCMIFAPTRVRSKEEQEVVGMQMTFFLGLGICLGAMASGVVVRLV